MRTSKTPNPRHHLGTDVLTSFPPQVIPNATTIRPHLISIGLSCGRAEEISNAYLKACDELRSVCEASLRKAIASLEGPVTTQTVENMVRIWSAEYSKQANIWAESAFSRAHELVVNTLPQNNAQKKSSFNYVRDPMLSNYFTDTCE